MWYRTWSAKVGFTGSEMYLKNCHGLSSRSGLLYNSLCANIGADACISKKSCIVYLFHPKLHLAINLVLHQGLLEAIMHQDLLHCA